VGQEGVGFGVQNSLETPDWPYVGLFCALRVGGPVVNTGKHY
jgi:predicted phage gp36 major capsid-like protein